MKAIIVAMMLTAPMIAGAAGSNQLIAVPAATKGAAMVSLDFVAGGDAAGFQFKIDVGVKSANEVDLSGCTAGLPKNRAGSCGFKDGVVTGVVYSPDGTAIPAGVVSVGRIAVKGGAAQAKVLSVEAFDVAGNDLPASLASGEK